MNSSIITNAGLGILNKSIAGGDTVQYWIGYYGLAYVPDEARELDSEMTSLVPSNSAGDEIYNIFQGSMADTVAGFDEGDVDSAAGKLYRQCLYAENIENTFRYSLVSDTDGNKMNSLVALEQSADNPSVYTPKFRYVNLTNNTPQTRDASVVQGPLPVPAPLFYDPSSGSRDNLWVSADMRNYEGKVDYWNASNESTRIDPYAEGGTIPSISNFNRYHAPSSSEGFAVDYQPACRNMSIATKLFPIEHYDLNSIVRSDGLIKNLEMGRSSTAVGDMTDSKVGTVTYKLSVNLTDYRKKASARTSLSPSVREQYPISFKFNRIGIYAVPVTLHAFNVENADNTKCGGNKVQIEIQGDEEPVLFAVIDIETVEMSETGLGKFDIDFSVKFAKDTALVNNPVIYYNLYENDAITWYKNQLIANASISEAVTTLGVQLNYVRNMIESLNARSADCGIGDDGDLWAFKNHTHPYMRNIVDTSNVDHGGVRGIYTKEEKKTYAVAHSTNNPDYDAAAPMFTVSDYMVGQDSMNLGKDSLTASPYSFNMSVNGLLGSGSSSTILMGGSVGSLEPSQVAVDSASNSIINVCGETEISSMQGSLWMTSGGRPLYVNTPVKNSIGLGRIDTYANDPSNKYFTTTPQQGVVENSGLFGTLGSYASIANSVIADSFDMGQLGFIGKIDLMECVPSDDLLEMLTDGQSTFDDIYSPILSSGITKSLLLASNTNIGRNVNSVLALGTGLNQTRSHVASNTDNSIFIGCNINAEAPKRTPLEYLTVDEFNARYSSVADLPDENNNPFAYSNTRAPIIVGEGEIDVAQGNGLGRYTKNVKGVTFYISYDTTEGWSIDEPTISGIDAYQHAGHNTKNLVVVGDNNSVGYSSHDSVIIGDSAASSRIIYQNSFIHNAGSHRNQDAKTYEPALPKGVFDNVWWIGHNYSEAVPAEDFDNSGASGYRCEYSNVGNFIFTQINNINSHPQFSDVFAFIGRNNRQFSFPPWYGTVPGYAHSRLAAEGLEDSQFYQPCKSPMMYTGGLALGGYGELGCNFMLLKVGSAGCLPSDVPDISMEGRANAGANIWVPDMGPADPNESTNACKIRNLIRTTYGDPTEDSVEINANGLYDLYDEYRMDGVHHLTVKSPYHGMVLMVQDKQELDGTLHVGLGHVTNDIIVFQDDGAYVPYPGAEKFIAFPTDDSAHPYTYYSLFQDGKFTIYEPNLNDGITGLTANVDPYRSVAGTNDKGGVRFGATTRMVWNTWYGVTASGKFDSAVDIVKTFYNTDNSTNAGNRIMYVETDHLLDGVVYEIRINIRSIGNVSNDSDGTFNNGEGAFGGMLAPGPHNHNFKIQFEHLTSGNGVVPDYVYSWADSTHGGSMSFIKPTFVPVHDDATGQLIFKQSVGSYVQPPVMASAVVYFVKVDGKIYVMGY